jgi:fumarate reductase subunit C
MVWDIFNSLRGVVFQKIKHFVFPVLVMFSCRVFLTTGSEVLKNKRDFYQGHIKNKKPILVFTKELLSCSYRCHFDTYFSQVPQARIVALLGNHFWN